MWILKLLKVQKRFYSLHKKKETKNETMHTHLHNGINSSQQSGKKNKYKKKQHVLFTVII